MSSQGTVSSCGGAGTGELVDFSASGSLDIVGFGLIMTVIVELAGVTFKSDKNRLSWRTLPFKSSFISLMWEAFYSLIKCCFICKIVSDGLKSCSMENLGA